MSNEQIDFSSLNPYRAFYLYGDTPEFGDKVREYLASLTHYTTEWDQGPVATKKKIYTLMTNIQTLTLSIYGYLSHDFYLRPSIKAIHMNFHLTFLEGRDSIAFELLHNGGFLNWFQTLETYLREHPESQLDEIHINFAPEVQLYLCLPDYNTVNYDRYGPIYEDEEWLVTTRAFKPSEYLCSLSEESEKDINELGEKLLSLLEMRPWKAITLPYHFPSAALVAERYPFATFTEEIDIEESRDRLGNYVTELHAEHRRTVKPYGCW